MYEFVRRQYLGRYSLYHLFESFSAFMPGNTACCDSNVDNITETVFISRIENIALNVDLAPTFLDIAGVEAPEHMDGRSLLPFLTNSSTDAPWRTSFLIERLVVTPDLRD